MTLSLEELQKLQRKQRAKNTDRTTQFGVNLLQKYLVATGSQRKVEDMQPEELNNTLISFYPGARTEKGERYKLNTLKNLRFGLQRYFSEKRGVDIISDPIFNSSNTCFENVCKLVVQAGKGDTSHHAEIEPEDIQKLYANFDLDDQFGLQEKVWLDIMFYMCRRGREGLRGMEKTTFCVSKDATGRRFVCQKGSEFDKNHGINDDQCDTNGEGRIYETGDKLCPVASFQKYMSHLHPMEKSLWQRPLDKLNPLQKIGQQIWYYRAPLGEKKLGNMMAAMSIKYQLSQRYTNHSVRVTSLQLMEDNNIEGRHIVRISGHKSIESINSYARRLSAARKRKISQIFSNHASTTQLTPTFRNQAGPTPLIPTFRLCPDSLRNEDEEELARVDFNIHQVPASRPISIEAPLPTTTTTSPPDLSRYLGTIPFDCNNCSFTFNIGSK